MIFLYCYNISSIIPVSIILRVLLSLSRQIDMTISPVASLVEGKVCATRSFRPLSASAFAYTCPTKRSFDCTFAQPRNNSGGLPLATPDQSASMFITITYPAKFRDKL